MENGFLSKIGVKNAPCLCTDPFDMAVKSVCVGKHPVDDDRFAAFGKKMGC